MSRRFNPQEWAPTDSGWSYDTSSFSSSSSYISPAAWEAYNYYHGDGFAPSIISQDEETVKIPYGCPLNTLTPQGKMLCFTHSSSDETSTISIGDKKERLQEERRERLQERRQEQQRDRDSRLIGQYEEESPSQLWHAYNEHMAEMEQRLMECQ